MVPGLNDIILPAVFGGAQSTAGAISDALFSLARRVSQQGIQPVLGTLTGTHRAGGQGSLVALAHPHARTPGDAAHLAGRDKANRVVVPGTASARSAGCVGGGRGRRLPGGALDDLLCHPV
jgi:hypothetical protein